jgi:hypothetical protein
MSEIYKPFLWCRLREPPLVSALLNSTELVPKVFPMFGRGFDSHRPLYTDVAHSDAFQFRRSRISGNHPVKIPAVTVEKDWFPRNADSAGHR